MKISDSQFQRISEYFDNTIPNGIRCPICGENDWIIGDSFADVLLNNDKDETFVFPTIIISCKHCGNVQFFNAFKIGIVEPNEFSDSGYNSNEIQDGK